MGTKVTEVMVHNAVGIILADRKAYDKSLNYAINYCRESQSQSGETLRVQCLYILNNISHWRHPLAKSVREVLRTYTKGE